MPFDKPPRSLQVRVESAAERLLATGQPVNVLDVMMEIRWLVPHTRKSWELGREPSLCDAMPQISDMNMIMCVKHLEAWAARKGLKAMETPNCGDGRERTHTQDSTKSDEAW
jgi:hypothetical protein